MYSKFSIVEFSSNNLLVQQEQQQGEQLSNKKKSLNIEHMPKKRGRPTKNVKSSNNTCMFIKSTEAIPVRYHPYIYVNTNKLNKTNAIPSPSSPHVNNVSSSPTSTNSACTTTTHACNNNTENSCLKDSFKNRIVRTSISIRELLN